MGDFEEMVARAGENATLIEQAKAGNMQPLIDRLKRGVQTSSGADMATDYDGGFEDNLWPSVMMAGLSDKQMNQCYDAIGAK